MKPTLAAGFAGALFGVGLGISGMTRPEKVVGFLDLAGAWDASLAFVMLGAIAVHLVAYRLLRRRASPLLRSFTFRPGMTSTRGSCWTPHFSASAGGSGASVRAPASWRARRARRRPSRSSPR